MNLKSSALAALSAATLLTVAGGAIGASAVDGHHEPTPGTTATRTTGKGPHGPVTAAPKTHGTDRAPDKPTGTAHGYDSTLNHPEYWEQLLANKGFTGVSCHKLEGGFAGAAWTVDADHALVVLKSALVNDQFWGVAKGETLRTVSGKGISHVIVCDGVPGTVPSSTPTTTVPDDDGDNDCKDHGKSDHPCDTPTPSVPPTTHVPGPAPTTAVPTVTAVPSPTVTAVPSTGSASVTASTSVPPAASPTSVAPLPQQDNPTDAGPDAPALAQTGANLGLALLSAVGATGAGAAFLVASRRRR